MRTSNIVLGIGGLALTAATAFGLGWAASAPDQPDVACDTFEMADRVDCVHGSSGKVEATFKLGAYQHHKGHWVVPGANCPTEDSCKATYGELPDGTKGWSIEETHS